MPTDRTAPGIAVRRSRSLLPAPPYSSVAFELLAAKLYLKQPGVFATIGTDFALPPAMLPGGSNGEEVPRSMRNPVFLAVVTLLQCDPVRTLEVHPATTGWVSAPGLIATKSVGTGELHC